MWLIPRRTNGLGSGRIPLPQPVRDALVRWYAGKGSRHDEEAGIMLVQQARIGEKWIACDCLQSGESPPILTPAFLSAAETYYLRRLTSTDRHEHHLRSEDHTSELQSIMRLSYAVFSSQKHTHTTTTYPT